MKYGFLHLRLSFLVALSLLATVASAQSQKPAENQKFEVVGGAVATSSQDGSGGGTIFGFRYTPQFDKPQTPNTLPTKPPYSIELLFNTSARKTITNEKDFTGTSLLSPDRDSQGFQVRYVQDIKRNLFKSESALLDTLSFYMRAGTSQLGFKDANASTKDPINGSVISLFSGFLLKKALTYDIQKDAKNIVTSYKEFNYGVFGGLSLRKLSGNILLTENEVTRKNLFGTGRSQFLSSEVGVFLHTGSVIYFASHTNFGGQLKSFSGSQIMIGAEAIIKMF